MKHGVFLTHRKLCERRGFRSLSWIRLRSILSTRSMLYYKQKICDEEGEQMESTM